MEIAVIGSRGIPARYGGFETLAEKIAEKLPYYGFGVHIFGNNGKELFFNKVYLHSIKCPRGKGIEKVCLSNLSILNIIFKKNIDVILMLGVSGAPLIPLANLFGKKVILNPDGLEWKRSKWGAFGKKILKFFEYISVRFSSKIVVDSEGIGEYIKLKYGRDTVFIPYGAETEEFSLSDWEKMKKIYSLEKGGYYIAVGRDVPENNFDIIIKGFLQSDSNKKLVIVCNKGKSYEKYNNYSKKIVFTGPIYERKKLFTLRYNAFAHIHGHSVGGTNPSLLEAIAAGNFVIAYDIVFNREVLGNYGFYFSDEKELANKINILETRGVEKNDYLNYYEKILKEKYNWDVVIRKYAEVLKSSV